MRKKIENIDEMCDYSIHHKKRKRSVSSSITTPTDGWLSGLKQRS